MYKLHQSYISSYKVKLYIKNMVCIRCKLVVKAELEKLGIDYLLIELGEVETASELSSQQRSQLDIALKRSGLELMDDKKSVLIEKIKCIIIDTVYSAHEKIKINLSDYISDKLNYDYTYLASLFSEVTGITIEKFYIGHKIEKAKELLIYDELNLTEIAYELGYSSVAHLSNQFKKNTGLSPSHFKKLKKKRRTMLENH